MARILILMLAIGMFGTVGAHDAFAGPESTQRAMEFQR